MVEGEPLGFEEAQAEAFDLKKKISEGEAKDYDEALSQLAENPVDKGVLIEKEVTRDDFFRMVEEKRKSMQEQYKDFYIAKNACIVDVYLDLEESGQTITDEVRQEFSGVLGSWQRFSEALKVSREKLEQGEDIGGKRFEQTRIFLDKIEPNTKAAKILFDTLSKLSTEEIGSGFSMNFSETSFAIGYPAFFNIQLGLLLDEEQLNQCLQIQSSEDALRFIESKPLTGKRIAEIGGAETTIFELLGAEVDNRSTFYRKKNEEMPNINIDNFREIFSEGSYDLTCSHMLLDLGSGIEHLREKWFEQGEYRFCSMEMMAVFGLMTKTGGHTLHVGNSNLICCPPSEVQLNKELAKSALALFEDGSPKHEYSTGQRKYNVSDLRGRFLMRGNEFWSGDWIADKEILGLEIKYELGRTDGDKIGGLAASAYVFEKVNDGRIGTFEDIEQLAQAT